MDYLADIHECKFRDELIALESATIEMEQAVLSYNAAARMSEIHAHEAELRCYAEGGDVFTLAEYYEAAEQKDAQNKEGLFQQIWTKVKNVWNKIRSFLSKDTSGGNEKDMVEINSPMYTLANLIAECGTEINKMITHPIQYFKEAGGWGKLAEIVAFTAATKGIKKVARGELEKLKDKLNGLVEKVTGPFDKIPGKIQAWAKDHGWGKDVDEVDGFIPKLLARMSSAVSAVTAALHIGKKDDQNQNADQGATNGAPADGQNNTGDNNPADQNNGGQNPPQNDQPKNNGQNGGGQNPPQNAQNNGDQKKKGFVGKAVDKAKKGAQKVNEAVWGKKKNGEADGEKTESGEDFINDVFAGLEGFTESDDSDIQHLIENMDEDFEESGEKTVMETVDELTDLFKGYF